MSEFINTGKTNIVHEFLLFLWTNKLWWMMPVVLVMGLLVALMIFAAQSSATPFIYALF